MPTIKIAFFETDKNEQEFFTKKLGKNAKLYFSPHPIGEDDKFLSEVYDADILCVFVGSRVNKSVLQSFSNLKATCTLSTGFDHIDTVYAKEKNIAVYNVPTYGQNTVAEHAMALILCISRKILKSNESIKRGDFDNTKLCGFDLKGKNIAIIGCGNIGGNLAKMCYGFGMNIYIYDVVCDQKISEKFEAKYLPLEEAIKIADIISLHLPLNDKTNKIIDEKMISKMKKGVVLINTARGGLIDSTALYKALIEKKIGYVGLDVFEEETYFKDDVELIFETDKNSQDFKTVLINHLLINHPRVVATPHNAYNSKESIQRILDTTLVNILNALKGKKENRVN